VSYFRTQSIRIVEFNVENLFVLLDFYNGQDFATLSQKEWKRLSSSTTPNKPIAQVRAIAQAIREMDPDILMLCEVGGMESLSNFNRYFLDDRYAPHLIEGNSDRGIDLGYLVRRTLPFKYDLISHKHRSIDFLYPHEKLSQETGYDHLRSARLSSHRFSRDVLELRVFEEGVDVPVLIVLLVHLKSQLDRNRIDPQGRDRRRAELEKLVKIYAEISDEFGGRTPVLLGGDFNGVVSLPNPDPEFEALHRDTELRDALEIAGASTEDRFTHMQIHPRRESINKQLDYIFVPPELAARVDAANTWVYRFKDEMGMTMLIPRTLNEKKLLPSDHYPLILTLRGDTR
jgi:endonuclease/exonuclease/phosphatase family metal-dependent hydrolase